MQHPLKNLALTSTDIQSNANNTIIQNTGQKNYIGIKHVMENSRPKNAMKKYQIFIIIAEF